MPKWDETSFNRYSTNNMKADIFFPELPSFHYEFGKKIMFKKAAFNYEY